MKEFTIEELSQYNGKENSPVYIAFKGKVYDVTNSFLWKWGRHQMIHNAGCDLSKELDEAPHDEGLLKRFPQIGILKD